jgi:hypothetical protein
MKRVDSTNTHLLKPQECWFFLKFSLMVLINFSYFSSSLLEKSNVLNQQALGLSVNERRISKVKGCYHGKEQQKNELNQKDLPGYRTELTYRCGATYYQPPFTALIPENLLTKTAQDLPTFFWYIPYQSIQEAEFTLVKDLDIKSMVNPDCIGCFNADLMDLEDFQQLGQVVYHTTIPLAGVPGIIRFTVPFTQNLPALEIGQRYFWQLKLVPEDYKNSPKPEEPLPVVNGWIQRINLHPILRSQLNQSSLQVRTGIYANYGIWNDVLTTLAELSCSNRNSPTSSIEWQSALKALNLDNLAGKPLVNCSSTKK